MKKLFFFKSSSSSSGNGTDKQIRRDKESGKNSLKNQFMKSQSEESGGVQALRRSRSLSSAAFLGDGNDPINCSGSNQHRQRNHSSRFRCFTPETQCKKGESSHMYKVHDSSGTLSTCSSNVSSQVLDRYIDGEEHLERNKQQKSGSLRSNLSGSIKGKRVTSRVQSPSPLSDYTRLNLSSSADYVEDCLKDASPRSLARSVVERLSHTHGKSKALSSYEPMRKQDFYGGCNGKTLDSSLAVFANLPLAESYEPVTNNYTEDHTEHQELFLHGKNRHVGTNYGCKEDNVDSELERKYKEAEKRVKVLSEELEEQMFLSDRDFNIRHMEEERLGLAIEVLNLLRSKVVERDSSREEIKRAKTDKDFHIKRLEKEKSELGFELEKELDRRSSEWTLKLETFQHEEKRLRERVRELAEHNVSLQREVSTFHEKETERIHMLRHMEETVMELSATTEETREENSHLMQNLSKLQQGYNDTTKDLSRVRRDSEEKDMECKELNKSITNLLRTCKEQEKTIQGLRDCLSKEIKKQPSEKHEEICKKLQMEQIRLTGVEFSLRKELESMKLEADSLRRMNRVKENEGGEADTMNFKLDNEMKMRVCHLQDQGVSMLNESTQLCYKFLNFLKEKLAQFPESYQDMKSMNNGLSEQILIESEMSVHGIRRGTESLKRSLQTVASLLLEKSNEMASESSSSSAERPRSHSEEESLRAELRAETLITRLLREKLYSMEQETERLQAEVAAGVRGNEVLQCEIRNTLDNLSINAHQLKDLKLQMVKKEENIHRLQTNLQESAKELANMRVTLTKVLEEREQLWSQVCECRERNMDMESEKEMLKKKVEKLEEDTLFKEGQITILKDTLGSKHFDLFSSPEFSYNDFLVQ